MKTKPKTTHASPHRAPPHAPSQPNSHSQRCTPHPDTPNARMHARTHSPACMRTHAHTNATSTLHPAVSPPTSRRSSPSSSTQQPPFHTRPILHTHQHLVFSSSLNKHADKNRMDAVRDWATKRMAQQRSLARALSQPSVRLCFRFPFLFPHTTTRPIPATSPVCDSIQTACNHELDPRGSAQPPQLQLPLQGCSWLAAAAHARAHVHSWPQMYMRAMYMYLRSISLPCAHSSSIALRLRAAASAHGHGRDRFMTNRERRSIRILI